MPMVSNFVTEVNVNSSLQMFVVEEEVTSGGNGKKLAVFGSIYSLFGDIVVTC